MEKFSTAIICTLPDGYEFKKYETPAKKTSSKKIHAIIGPSVGDHGNDSFFVKEAAEMKALIDKVGLPKEFYEKK